MILWPQVAKILFKKLWLHFEGIYSTEIIFMSHRIVYGTVKENKKMPLVTHC